MGKQAMCVAERFLTCCQDDLRLFFFCLPCLTHLNEKNFRDPNDTNAQINRNAQITWTWHLVCSKLYSQGTSTKHAANLCCRCHVHRDTRVREQRSCAISKRTFLIRCKAPKRHRNACACLHGQFSSFSVPRDIRVRPGAPLCRWLMPPTLV